MLNLGKYRLIKTDLWGIDYEFILKEIEQHIKKRQSFLISPLASQTLVKAYFDTNLQNILNKYDGLFPDSQWVKRSLYFLYGVYLKERVYGPELMLRVCKLAEERKHRIFLYGITDDTLKRLENILKTKFPNLRIVGIQPSKFDSLNILEKKKLISTIEKTKTDILLIALGSPLEQIFAYNLLYQKPVLRRKMVVLPIGAAFDFISGVKSQAPRFMQNSGFEWLFRLVNEPLRLWSRYLVLGSLFVFLIILQKMKLTFISMFDFVFFYQKRVGKDKKIFTLYKIRTMVNNAELLKEKYQQLNEANGPVFKIRDDPRYTKIGKFLAHTGLDELPQLINVIKGEMAFVGPRPLPVDEASKVPKKYEKRFSVLPGITSLWIVKGAHKLSFREWMELDLEYVRNKSVWLDMKISLLTVLLILKSILFYFPNNIILKIKGRS